MKESFKKTILKSHLDTSTLPSTKATEIFITRLMNFLFPIRSNDNHLTEAGVQVEWEKLIQLFETLLIEIKECDHSLVKGICKSLFQELESIHEQSLADAQGILEGDPAATNLLEVIGTYPGFYAISIYRVAHHIYKLDVPYLPRMLTEHAHSVTGIDIHPGAQIGRGFCIDHGTGIVIGETCIIGDHVKIYQGVTLGGLSVKKEMAKQKRHPTIEDNVVIYAGTTILGGDTVIGRDSMIGGNVWLTESVPPQSFIYYSPQGLIKNKKNEGR